MNMSELLKKLETYADSDYLPMHMPGHKRQIKDFGNPFEIDITEIHGFDNLHHAEGVLKEAQERLAPCHPLLVDAVPLTLEEIFIYELGGVDYAVRDIVL